jgi:hypothetical protein
VAERLWTAQWRRLRRAYSASLPVRCEVCGEMVRPGQPWDLDHRTPRSQGGALCDQANLRVLHRRCNRLSSRRLAWESKLRRREEEALAARRRWVESISVTRRTSIPPVAPVESVEKSRIF